jgi:hypothetical protein
MTKSRTQLEAEVLRLRSLLRKEAALRRLTGYCAGAIFTSGDSSALALVVECEIQLGISHTASPSTSQMRDIVFRAFDKQITACATIKDLNTWLYQGL